MTKDVIISVKGNHLMDDATGEPVEIITPGTYYKKEDAHYVFYEEIVEGVSATIKNRIVIKDERVELNKTGGITVKMCFDRLSIEEAPYKTPYGVFPLKIETSSVDLNESEDVITCKVKYVIYLDESKLSDSEISISIESKGQATITDSF